MRMRRSSPVLALTIGLLAFLPAALAQTGSVSGIVRDPSRAVVADATVKIASQENGWSAETVTNNVGIYSFPFVMRGHYLVEARAQGFETARLELTVEGGGSVTSDLNLSVAASAAVVSVNGAPDLVNTTDGSVSSVVNRSLINSLPLNGRTINALLDLMPGVTNSPVSAATSGQYSINGQRTDGNYLTVDGVSANFGYAATSNIQAGGQFAVSALGGTNSLVSTDAIEEFRVYTSSFAPEFGRTPGGQIQISTRSGTNALHGSLFEYFRNDKLDANDWFADSVGKAKAPERHNDFGGVVGGPIVKNKLFYFVSHETLLLRQPQAMQVLVPSEASRLQGTPLTQSILNSYPIPDAAASNPNASTFTGVWSNTASLHATSARLDYLLGSKVSLFGRVDYAPSSTETRQFALNTVAQSNAKTSTVTAGANVVLTPRIAASFRFNFSQATSSGMQTLDGFGGAAPLNLAQFAKQELTPNLPLPAESQIYIAGAYLSSGVVGSVVQPQFNTTANFAFTLGKHELKTGVDIRTLSPYIGGLGLDYGLLSFLGPVNNNFDEAVTGSREGTEFLQVNYSTFVQDTWRISPRLTLTYGLRWDVNPPPSGVGNTQLYQFRPYTNLSQATLQPVSELWSTRWNNIAPRVGIAYRLTNVRPLVLRAGVGTFYDSATGGAANLGVNAPYSITNTLLANVSLPLNLPAPSLVPPYNAGYQFDPNLKTPNSLQWNTAIESQLTPTSSVSATYIGQRGTSLLRESGRDVTATQFSFFGLTDNTGWSDYQALQLQARRRGTRLNATANYTWSHSIDLASSDAGATLTSQFVPTGLNKGSSDFDVRHSASTGISYLVGSTRHSGVVGALFGGWGLDGILRVHSGFPITMSTLSRFGTVSLRPDLVTGVPLWVSNPNVATGERLNSAAFLVPKTLRQGTLGRNVLYGPGLAQLDAGITRNFKLTEALKLSFRLEAFNVLNHPNFANQNGVVGNPLFGISGSMLNQSLGGLNPLFQVGGPRSLQVTGRIVF
jgi:hypothetical protein